MSSELFPPIPNDTARVARSVFGRSNFYLAIGDQVNNLFSGLTLDPSNGSMDHTSRTKPMLYLITIFQYLETLPDDSAADALRVRVDWKYALHLPLNYAGIRFSSFCEFRRWLQTDISGRQTLDNLLTRLDATLLSTGKSCLSLPAGGIVERVCLLNRLDIVWDSIRELLGVLAARQPNWLRENSLPHWYERYGTHRKTTHLAGESSDLEAFAQSIGSDGDYLLKAISEADVPALKNSPEVLAIIQVWRDQFEYVEGKISWRMKACSHCSPPIHRKEAISMR